MEKIKLVELQTKYADEIWEFRQEILENDAEERALEMVEKFNLKLLNAPLPMTFCKK